MKSSYKLSWEKIFEDYCLVSPDIVATTSDSNINPGSVTPNSHCGPAIYFSIPVPS
jgi:hypothetical protein